jgi:hypothetical protein
LILSFRSFLLVERYITAKLKWHGSRKRTNSVITPANNNRLPTRSVTPARKHNNNSKNNCSPKTAIVVEDHSSDALPVKQLISRLKRFETFNLTAMLIDGYDDDPQRQQRLEYRARVILETAMKWFPKPALVRANIYMQMFEKRAKAFAAACNFLADSPVVLDEVVRDREEAAAVEGEEVEWEGCSSDDG